jgi:Fe(3+) dicitrate transport protein
MAKDADFNYIGPGEHILHDYRFPNRNASLFLENIFYIHEKLSITPGLRFEYINTTADGYYSSIPRDLAGNIISVDRTDEYRNDARQFVIAGLGISYKPVSAVEMYANISQNYRSITFSDMRIVNPSSEIDQNLQDETGYSLDLGIRSEQTKLFNYDVSVFYLNYDNRIGEVSTYDKFNKDIRRRENIGQAIIKGIEAYGEADLVSILYPERDKWNGVLFTNLAYIHSVYSKSKIAGVKGNEVEFVPAVNLKSGVRIGYRNVKASLQYSHLSSQYSDAKNDKDGGIAAVVGTIPAYSIVDVSLSYAYKKLKAEFSINNLTDQMYFTRRATGYPGPGILPSDGRGYFLTLQVKL